MRDFDFTFKQFGVHHDKSSLRVGTDAVLLGAWADISDSHNILEIGTGCGVIALALAQRSEASIIAIEIDQSSSFQAQENFHISPWKERLKSIHCSLQEYQNEFSFDLIVSNPPFFDNAFKAPDEKRNNARHTDTLSFEELVHSASNLLTSNGRFCVILPYDQHINFETICLSKGLYLSNILKIRPKSGKEFNRVLMSFEKKNTVPSSATLIIRNEDNSYTSDYKELTKDFYLKF
jgi:tRNA1Val (adenine37-N6)-methyltransferase